MTITPDQTALLELLLGGQSFSELDDLLGLDEGESRVRARAALSELGDGADPDRNVALTDYLLGQADPIDRADAVRHLRQDPADHAVAGTILAKLGQSFPEADLPDLPAAPGGRRRLGGGGAAKPAPGKPSSAGQSRFPRVARPDLSSQQTRLFTALGSGAVVLIAIVLAVSGVFSGDESSSSPASSGDSAADASQDASSPLPEGQEVTRVPLAPQGSGDAAGAAIVGITTNDQPYLDLVIENLEPAPQDQAYIAWFMFDENTGYPVPTPIVPEQGSFEDRIAIPVEVSGAISRSQSIEVSLSDTRELLRAIQTAADANELAIERPGRTILSGDVPQPSEQAQGDQLAPGESQGGAGGGN